MSSILIILLALFIYAVFAVLRARNRDEMRAREIETEARFAAEAERISLEGERQEISAAEQHPKR